MIIGIGIDMIEVERVAEKIEKEMGFRELVFSHLEIEYCEKKKHKYQHYAARFCAKEAFLKAIGTGWKSPTALNEIEIIHDLEGKPRLELRGEAALAMKEKGLETISVSLSHLSKLASAIVIIEK